MSKKKRIIVVIILFVLVSIIAFYNGLVVKKYTIETNKIPKDASLKIVLVSDLHSHIYGKNQKKIVNLIKKQNPDIIALAGDIADDVEPIEGAQLFLAAIQDIAPVYYVTGNHEFWSEEINFIRDTFRKYNVKILENDYEELLLNGGLFIIGGVDDPDIVTYENPLWDWEGEIYTAFSGLQDPSGYKILISHRAECVYLYKNIPFDLVLSGHAHGGQVRIPFFLNGLFSPNQGWFPKYAGGMYVHEEFNHIVSRGVSFNLRLPRIFNPPEIVVIDIKSTE